MGIMQDPHPPCDRERFPGWNRSAVSPGDCQEAFNRNTTGTAGLCVIATDCSSRFGALLRHGPEPGDHPSGAGISVQPAHGTGLPMLDID